MPWASDDLLRRCLGTVGLAPRLRDLRPGTENWRRNDSQLRVGCGDVIQQRKSVRCLRKVRVFDSLPVGKLGLPVSRAVGGPRTDHRLQVRSWKGEGRPSAGGTGRGERTGGRTNQQLADEAGCSVSVISAVKREIQMFSRPREIPRPATP